jgi:hypothetical protein
MSLSLVREIHKFIERCVAPGLWAIFLRYRHKWEGTVRKFVVFGPILVAFLAFGFGAAPAHAQATRTWVSGVGDDANPCSRTAPCKTFAGAISKTAPGGEIDCLDSGGFGAVTITKAISIMCDEVSNGGVLVSGTNAIIVQAGPLDKVLLSGLDIEGLGTGVNGVGFNSGLELIIHDCWIHDFATTGVNVASNTAGARVVIKDSKILNNGTSGNGATGGVAVQGNGVNNIAILINTLVENNLNFGVQVTGAANRAAFMTTFVNPTGIASVNSGQLLSIGPSNFFASVSGTLTLSNYQ